jgi:hypothetical protein
VLLATARRRGSRWTASSRRDMRVMFVLYLLMIATGLTVYIAIGLMAR